MRDNEGNEQGTYREHLEAAARRGSKVAIEELAGPEMPEEAHYLYAWALQVHGRSGIGMGGIAPLTYSTIADWSRLTNTSIEPHEVEALLRIDATMIAPPEEEVTVSHTQQTWPERKD